MLEYCDVNLKHYITVNHPVNINILNNLFNMNGSTKIEVKLIKQLYVKGLDDKVWNKVRFRNWIVW